MVLVRPRTASSIRPSGACWLSAASCVKALEKRVPCQSSTPHQQREQWGGVLHVGTGDDMASQPARARDDVIAAPRLRLWLEHVVGEGLERAAEDVEGGPPVGGVVLVAVAVVEGVEQGEERGEGVAAVGVRGGHAEAAAIAAADGLGLGLARAGWRMAGGRGQRLFRTCRPTE